MRRQERGRREREEKGEREGEEGGRRKDEEGRRENGGMQELLRWTMLRRSSAMLLTCSCQTRHWRIMLNFCPIMLYQQCW